jgi:hypothetical protein
MEDWLLELRQPKIGTALDEIQRMFLVELIPQLKIAKESLFKESKAFPKDSHERIWRSNVSEYISNILSKLNSVKTA